MAATTVSVEPSQPLHSVTAKSAQDWSQATSQQSGSVTHTALAHLGSMHPLTSGFASQQMPWLGGMQISASHAVPSPS